MPLPELARRAVAGGVDIVQLRDMELDHAELRMLAIQILDALGDPSRLMINGSPSIARELGIGLHLPEAMAGTVDLQTAAYRRLSRSVHAGARVDAAAPFDFVIAGHVFETASKPDSRPLGLHGLRHIVATSSQPVLAIGGMTPKCAGAVMSTGVAGIAAMSAINDSQNPESAANEFVSAMQDRSVMETQTAISIQVNGKPVAIEPNTTVIEFLKGRGHHERLVVVELNGTILKKTLFDTTELAAGDRVEVVHFVGGG